MISNTIPSEVSERRHRWQGLTLGLLVVGYSGFYLCRSDLSACTPAICDELKEQGWDYNEALIRVGDMASLGVLTYAVGKFIGGWSIDRIGGRRGFLGAMFIAVVCTAAFARGDSFAVWIPLWLLNRFGQSFGWPGMVRICSRWFPPTAYGFAMAALSLSFLFGDAAARWSYGQMFTWGFGWRDVFAASGAISGLILLINVFFLHESPRGVELPEAQDHFQCGQNDEDVGPNLMDILRQPAFWVACGMCFGLTIGRETFNTWTATYFRDVIGLTNAEAADASKGFPLYGGVAVFMAGLFRDRLGRAGQTAILVGGSIIAGCIMLRLGTPGLNSWAVPLVNACGFFLLAPYSYFSGVIALDFGGKKSGATASGIIDGVGYLGGMFAGSGMSRLVKHTDWAMAFSTLATITIATGLAAILYSRMTRRSRNGPAV
jgi:OPA family glycerol-3-phosphate transporter-like MFS transporter